MVEQRRVESGRRPIQEKRRSGGCLTEGKAEHEVEKMSGRIGDDRGFRRASVEQTVKTRVNTSRRQCGVHAAEKHVQCGRRQSSSTVRPVAAAATARTAACEGGGGDLDAAGEMTLLHKSSLDGGPRHRCQRGDRGAQDLQISSMGRQGVAMAPASDGIEDAALLTTSMATCLGEQVGRR